MYSIDAAMAASDRATAYGARESNPLWASGINHDDVRYDLGEIALGAKNDRGQFLITKIARLRLLTDSGCPFYDVSYCYGRHIDGYLVRVWLGTDQIMKRRGASLSRQLVALAQRAGRYAKGLGLLDPHTVSILR